MSARSNKSNGGHMAPAITGHIVGYARVSTDGQSLDTQLATLKAAGAATVYREKISGARSDRPQLQRLLVGLRPGDVLLVTRLDRLARSTRDLLNVLDTVAKAGASFRSIGDAWCDTTTAHGRSCSPSSVASPSSSGSLSAREPARGASARWLQASSSDDRQCYRRSRKPRPTIGGQAVSRCP